jgi:hypothetical protein
VPLSNTTWTGFASVPMGFSNEVPPGGFANFVFNFNGADTPGHYNFHFRQSTTLSKARNRQYNYRQSGPVASAPSIASSSTPTIY